MNILVCMSVVPDTTTKIKFNNESSALDATGIQWIINPWDELALTRAMELKETHGDTIGQVHVASVGPAAYDAVLRKALAVGADKAFRINTHPQDAFAVAGELAAFIQGQDYQVVLFGIESSDYNGAAVGGMVAEWLNYASVSAVSGLDIVNGEPVWQREVPGGQQSLKAPLPVIGIVQKGIAVEPRIPAMRGIMMARRKPLEVLEATGEKPQTQWVRYEYPPEREACEFIEPGNEAELVHKLKNEARIL